MPAFERAVDLGYRYLETDVQVTADGVVVAFHDDDLERTCGRAGTDLRAAVARGRDGARRRDASRSPARRSARGVAGGPRQHRLQDRSRRRSARRRARSPPARSTACASASFSDRRLAASASGSARGCARAPAGSSSALLRLLGWRARRSTPPRCRARRSVIPVVNKRFVDRAHRRGIEVHVWTIDDAAEMDRLLDLGVDGIMTDRPAVLREVLQRGEQWI